VVISADNRRPISRAWKSDEIAPGAFADIHPTTYELRLGILQAGRADEDRDAAW
jgi:hypothetical protein